jgi:sporulation protein YlmC with PRC-barrel domain
MMPKRAKRRIPASTPPGTRGRLQEAAFAGHRHFASDFRSGGLMVTRTGIAPDTDTVAPGGAPIIGAEYRSSDGPGPEIMSADTLVGDPVVNTAGDSLGDIKAIMLDVTSGHIAYAVLTFGGVFGIGSKLFAIPWSALTLDAAEKRFILDIPKERLENAPGFDKDHWPSMADPSWANELHTYYNVRPYWDDVRPEDHEPRTTGRGSMY